MTIDHPTIRPPTEIDPRHAAALADAGTLTARVQYACDQQPPPVTVQGVRTWLAAYGYPTVRHLDDGTMRDQRTYVSRLVNEWRRERGLGDTGEQTPLTSERLAELDDIAGRVPAPRPEPITEPVSPAPITDSAPAPAPTAAAATAPAAATVGPAPVDVSTAFRRLSGWMAHAPEPTAVAKPFPRWPLTIIALGAFVAVWSGWVGLGRLTGFGKVNLLPGIVDDGSWATIDTSITLPLGVEAYAAFALAAWLSTRVPRRARAFAGWSALFSLVIGMAGQGAYHLLVAHPEWLTRNSAGALTAPPAVVVAVSCLPVLVLGMGAALAHLVRADK